MSPRLLVIDANSLIHRAFHALPPLTAPDGRVVNAAYGFLLVLFKAIKELKPDYIAAAFDLPLPTFRHEQFKDYKAHRPKVPAELSAQIPLVKELLAKLHILVLEQPGFEADDIIGTIARQAPEQDRSLETIIVSGDLDTLQLVSPNTKVFAPKKGLSETMLYDEAAVRARFGFAPALLTDFKALQGDASDNIPGVPGIGQKTATALLQKFGGLENIYEALAKDLLPSSGKKIPAERLRANKDAAFFSKALSEIRTDAPLSFELSKARWQDYGRESFRALLVQLNFKSLLARLP